MILQLARQTTRAFYAKTMSCPRMSNRCRSCPVCQVGIDDLEALTAGLEHALKLRRGFTSRRSAKGSELATDHPNQMEYTDRTHWFRVIRVIRGKEMIPHPWLTQF